MTGKSWYEYVVKIAEPQEHMDVRDILRFWPLSNTVDFYQVHASHPLFKDYPQVIDAWCMEYTFLWFEV